MNKTIEVSPFVRVLNALPNMTVLNIYIDDAIFVDHLRYGSIATYAPVRSGNHKVEIFASGAFIALHTCNINFIDGAFYTICPVGSLRDIRLSVTLDYDRLPKKNSSLIKIVNLAYDAPSVDVIVNKKSVLLSDVSYTSYSEYAPLKPTSYAFSVVPHLSVKPFLHIDNITLHGGESYTIYMLGSCFNNHRLYGAVVEDML